MTRDELIQHYPRLYHMAFEGSWPSIQKHGLMTTQQLVEISDAGTEVRHEILSTQRRQNVVLSRSDGSRVVVRDQAPLRQVFLEKVLDDVSVQEWFEILNNRVFFWLHPERLNDLLNARRYRSSAHDVLTVDTAQLIEAHESRIELSGVNSGATLYPNAPRRGLETFKSISGFPFAERRRRYPLRQAVAELAVVGGVPDIECHVISVERRQGSEIHEVLFPSSAS